MRMLFSHLTRPLGRFLTDCVKRAMVEYRDQEEARILAFQEEQTQRVKEQMERVNENIARWKAAIHTEMGDVRSWN